MSSKSSIMALIAMAITVSQPAWSQVPEGGQTYFNISDDPESPKLLHLDEITDDGDLRYLPVTDIFGGDEPFGLLSVFKIDCPAETLDIVAAAQLTSDTTEPDIRPIDIDNTVDARASDWAWIMYRVACEGKADLERRRVYRGSSQT